MVEPTKFQRRGPDSQGQQDPQRQNGQRSDAEMVSLGPSGSRSYPRLSSSLITPVRKRGRSYTNCDRW